MSYRATIGLEIHVQLKTKTKLFCRCKADAFFSEPNTNVCPVCLGHPGVLPVLNREAVEKAVAVALALNCKINKVSEFARKNYFYPDLPKGYQITQYAKPLAENGYLEIEVNDKTKRVGIRRLHLEEDTGKLLYRGKGDRLSEAEYSLIDYNRSGIPLIEIVTEPDISSPEEARIFAQELRAIIRYLGASDADMEKGSLRIDANVSVSKGDRLGTKVEIKNMNSFRSLERALAYEIERQVKELEAGGEIIQETRHWDERKGQTISSRTKQEAHDYRYFPEPDLPPLVLDEEAIRRVKEGMPELPAEVRRKLRELYGLDRKTAGIIAAEREWARFFEEASRGADPQKVASWFVNHVLANLKDMGKELSETKLLPSALAKIVELVESGKVTDKVGRQLLRRVMETGEEPEQIVEREGLLQISDEAEIEALAREAIENNPKAVADYKNGKGKAIGVLIGYVMRKTGGRANPRAVREVLVELLKEG